jgi:hypothetical protein
LREDWLLAAPVVDLEPCDLGEAMNSEKHSAISPQIVGRLRGTVLELLRFWIPWRKYLYSNSNSHFGPEPAKSV